MNKLGTEMQCSMCGSSIERKSGGQKYCDTCRVQHKRDHDKILYAQKASERKRVEDNMKQIARINAEAMAAGMSYGKYVAMQYMKGK